MIENTIDFFINFAHVDLTTRATTSATSWRSTSPLKTSLVSMITPNNVTK